MRLQQPHPPGYPAYVFLARAFYAFSHDPVAALTTLSAVCGALSVLALYALASDLACGWAALPLAAMPLFWLNADMAMSDVPGLLFVIASIWMLNRAAMAFSSESRAAPQLVLPPGAGPALIASARPAPVSGGHATGAVDRGAAADAWPRLSPAGGAWRWWLAGGCALAGLWAGVRPQDVVAPLAVLAAYVAPPLLRRRAWRELALGGLAFGLACLLWLVPLLGSVDWDVQQLAEPIQTQLAYVRQADSMVGHHLSRVALADRLASFGSVFSPYFGGPAEGGLNAFLGLCAAAAALTVVAGRRRATWLAWSWLAPYGLVMLLVMQPTDPRKVLPAVPPLLLLLGAAGLRFARWKTACLAAGLALAAVFALKGAPLVRTLHTQLTPPEQAVAYVAAHYSSDDTIILAGNSLNHVYYELPQYDSVAIDFVTEDELAQQLRNPRYRWVISLDEWDTTVPLPADWQRGPSFDFERDPRVLPKASVVPFTVYSRA
jgi:transmembrane protein TMEM260 (protein O-mannosyltransferase)